ncbi:ABC transporter substrate-binding protein [Frankia sp. ACN1ag]|uniref:ABC transporter substrate-binding protein n=1 Tax=Frankia sp. ACN1ag TaxID=102891 RepID=UPI0007083916|nr:ABC transporter substrate-binding protein [Frankia sp. ACN1ag]KQC38163.1 hypothetical protein UK82_10775 [Frankia sp. ACN1ag]
MYQRGSVQRRIGGRVRGAVAVAVAAGLAVTLAACGSDSGGGSSAAASPAAASASSGPDLSGVTLRVATYPAAIGGDEALLKAAGLLDTPYKVRFQTYPDGGAQTGAVNQGSADLARGSGVANVLIAAGGTKPNFVSVATLRLPTSLQWTVAKKGITSIADLRGKKVAYTKNTTTQYFLLKQLASAGLTFKDIQPVPLTPADGLSALLGGSVDALAGFGKTVQVAVAKGNPILADGGPILKGSLGGLVGAYNAYTSDLDDPAKSAAIADYIGRIEASFAWTRAHPAEWDKITATNTNQPLESVTANFKASENSANSAVGPVDPKALTDQQAIADTFQAAGLLPGKVNVAGSYNTKLNPAIAAAIASYKAKFPANFAVTTVK